MSVVLAPHKRHSPASRIIVDGEGHGSGKKNLSSLRLNTPTIRFCDDAYIHRAEMEGGFWWASLPTQAFTENETVAFDLVTVLILPPRLFILRIESASIVNNAFSRRRRLSSPS